MRVHPIVIRQAVDFYYRRLVELNPIFLATPAAMDKINRQAEALRQGQKRKENNPVWDMRVQVQSDGVNPTRFLVIVDSGEP